MKLPLALTTVTPLSKYLALSLFVIIPILAFCVGYFIPKATKPEMKVSQKITATPTIKALPTFSSKDMKIPFTDATFRKRQYPTSSPFFFTFLLPKAITSIPESNLVGMKCTPSVSKNNNGYETFDYHESKWIKREGKAFYDSLGTFISEVTNSGVQGMAYCQTEQGKELVIYSNYSRTSIAEIDNNYLDVKTNFQSVYMDCGYPIQLTNNGELSYICRGGDTNEHADVYSINLEYPITPLLECVTGGLGTEDPPTCQ